MPVQDAPVQAAVAAQRFAAGPQRFQCLPLMVRHTPLLGHLIGAADAEDDDLGLGGHGDIFPGLGVRLEHQPQGRFAYAFRQVNHAVRAVRLGGDSSRDIVRLKFHVVPHAAAGRQYGRAGVAFRKHAGDFRHGRAAADGHDADAAEQIVEQQRALAPQLLTGRFIRIAVSGNNVHVLQA